MYMHHRVIPLAPVQPASAVRRVYEDSDSLSLVPLDDDPPPGGSLRARRRSEPRVAPRAGPPPGLTTEASLGLAPADESRAFWRLVRRAFESKASPAPAAAAAGGFWANAWALALVTAGPAAAAALQFGLPYPLIPHRIGRTFVFSFVGSVGAASNAAVWFAVLLRTPLRRCVPSYMALFLLVGPSLFAATNAAVDLTGVPFGYLTSLLFIVASNQVCARVHARALTRRITFAPVDPEGGTGAPAPDPAPDPARALATFGKFQVLNMCIVFVLFGYLFLFSVARATVAQVLINATNSGVCFVLVLLQLRAFGRSLAAALPHGDAAVLYALTMLLCVRVFRQLAFFRVQSVAVYLASLAADLLTLLLPSSLLLRRVALPVARRAAALLRRLSAGSQAAPEPLSPASPLSPTSADDLLLRPSIDSAGKPLAAAPAAAGGVEVRSLDEEAAGGEAAAAAAGGRAAFDEELWVFNVQTGIRSMLLWHAVISWAATATFAATIVVARWGPAAASFPYSRATFDDAACTSALTFSLLTAGVNGGVVALLQLASLLFPRLRDRFALTASWRFLREHAATLALTFSSCSSVAFLCLYRQANVYYFVFPESYPPDAPP